MLRATGLCNVMLKHVASISVHMVLSTEFLWCLTEIIKTFDTFIPSCVVQQNSKQCQYIHCVSKNDTDVAHYNFN